MKKRIRFLSASLTGIACLLLSPMFLLIGLTMFFIALPALIVCFFAELFLFCFENEDEKQFRLKQDWKKGCQL